MNPYYTNSGTKWSLEETEQLKKEYLIDKINIGEICKNHKRFIGGITSRLQVLGLINEYDDTRGYIDFITTNTYKEMEKEKKMLYNQRRKEKKVKSEKEIEEVNNNIYITIKKNDYNELKCELLHLKSELYDIKNMIKKLAIYEFED